MMDQRVSALLAEFGIKAVDKYAYPQQGETRALATLGRILVRRGEAHLRVVLSTLSETDNNHALLDEALLWATSDLVIACAEFVETRTSDWLELWDAIPVGYLQSTVQNLSGFVRQREALAGMIYERIFRIERTRETMAA